MTSVVQDSETVPVDGDDGFQKCLSYSSRQPEVKSTLPLSVELVAPDDFPNVNWIIPELEKKVQIDKPEDDVCLVEDTSPSEDNTVPTTIPSSPPLQIGSSLHRLDEILTRHWDNDTPQEFVASTVAEIRSDYDTRLSKDIAQWVKDTFQPSYGHRFRYMYMALAHRKMTYPELMQRNVERYRYNSAKYFDQWAASVVKAFSDNQNEGRDDEARPLYTNDTERPKAPCPAHNLKNEQELPDGEPVDSNTFLQEFGEEKPRKKAPRYETGAKLLSVTQRNEHAERIAKGYTRLSRQTNSGRRRVIIKANNIVLETQELTRSLQDAVTFRHKFVSLTPGGVPWEKKIPNWP